MPPDELEKLCCHCLAEERALKNGRPAPTDRRCPVCRRSMSVDPSASGSTILRCTSPVCGTTFNIVDATLASPGCDRTGKGVRGTNMVVRNCAKKRLASIEANKAEARLQTGREERRKRMREKELLLYAEGRHEVPPDADGADLVTLVLRCGIRQVQVEAFKMLHASGDRSQMEEVARSRSRWAELARKSLDSMGA